MRVVGSLYAKQGVLETDCSLPLARFDGDERQNRLCCSISRRRPAWTFPCATGAMMSESVACGLIVMACVVAVLFALYQVSTSLPSFIDAPPTSEVGNDACRCAHFPARVAGAGLDGPHVVASRAMDTAGRSISWWPR